MKLTKTLSRVVWLQVESGLFWLETSFYVYGFQQPSWGLSYERKVRTVPFTRPLQIGHFLNDGAHSLHTTRCPHGMKTMFTSLSIHTLQVRSSCRRRSCSSMGRSEKVQDPELFIQQYFEIQRFFFCGNSHENRFCITKNCCSHSHCFIIPERSWLGDEASLDWAKNVKLNTVRSFFSIKIEPNIQNALVHIGKIPIRSLSKCTSFFWIQFRKTSAAAFPLVRMSSMSRAVCCWADVWAFKPLYSSWAAH